MAGPTGKGRGRPPKSRVGEMKPPEQPSPVRRTTRQQNQNQVTVPDGQEVIDPRLADSPLPSDFQPPPIGQRGVRRNTDRARSMGTSLGPGSQTQASSDIQTPVPELHAPYLGGPVQQEIPTGAGLFLTSARGTSTSLEPKVIPSWKKERAARQLSHLWEFTTDLYRQLFQYSNLPPDDREKFDEWEEGRRFELDQLDKARRFFLENDHDTVIHPNYVLDNIMGRSADSPEGEQVFKKICATNFAVLLDEILTVRTKEPLPFLQSWDQWFPQVFYRGPEDCADQLQYILTIVIDLRTQLLHFTLKKSGASDPEAKIREVAKIFCTESTPLRDLIRDGQDVNIETKRISYINLDGADNGSPLRQLYTQRVRYLVSALEDPDYDLGEEYNFGRFLDDFARFVQLSFDRLQAMIDSDQGRSYSTDASRDASRVESQQLQLQLESEAQGHGYRSSEPISTVDPYLQAGVGRFASQDILYRSQMPNPSNYPGSNVFAPAHEPVGPDSSGLRFAESAARAVAMPKRTEPDVPESSAAPAPKRARTRRKRAQPSETPASGALVPVSGPQYPAPTQIDLENVAQLARERSAASRKDREPQVRSPWVRADTLLLIEAVHNYKCKWSAIERAIKEGQILFQRPRDQQALRDKARLLKQDMLKADALLPSSFDLVVLGKKERAAVIACGKNPNRKEADKVEDPPGSGKWVATDTVYVDGTHDD
ncbi:hypothetical protein V8F20_000826 [Naviculisporaceae sp. PSN 640]